MGILKEITELQNAGVITQDTADSIKTYYKEKKVKPSNGLFVIFGVLGAILVGLGIILMIAHNWDDLSRTTKTVFAFIPLIIGQLICLYVLMKKNDSTAWTESSAAFLFFAVGASISLVSQIYNIDGNLSSYLFTWMLLCLPLVYIMRSSIVALLYIAGISAYVVLQDNFLAININSSLFSNHFFEHYVYWLMLLAVIPHYYKLIKNKPNSNFTAFHNWFVPGSVMIALGTFSFKFDGLMFVAYMSLFSLFYMISNLSVFKSQRFLSNSYRIFASIGVIILLLILTFDSWGINRFDIGWFTSPELYFATIITAAALFLFIKNERNKNFKSINILSYVFLLFLVIFVSSIFIPFIHIFANIFVLVIGIQNIVKGVKTSNIGITNYGLLAIVLLVICRFFDTNFSFIVRGLLFLIVGVGFFVTNYQMIKKRNKLSN